VDYGNTGAQPTHEGDPSAGPLPDYRDTSQENENIVFVEHHYEDHGLPGNDHGQGSSGSSSSSSSDIRVKRDIVELGQLSNGIHLYRFRYKWADQRYVGVIAQEVRKIVPGAVLIGSDGYLRVDYSKLGLKLQTWDEWVRAHPQTALIGR
jgi:hypothetical protein